MCLSKSSLKLINNKDRITQKGFTLIEMAIVLVIIGFILGMVFKGKELIDSAKVKSLAAQYNKFLYAFNTFHERYGFYPGDGCTIPNPQSPQDCTGAKNGVLEQANERLAAWHLLINVTQILSANDRRSVLGQDWNLFHGDYYSYSSITVLDLPGWPDTDVKFVCALDKLIDDGRYNSGKVMHITTSAPSSNLYNENSDCWGLSGQVEIIMRILP